QYEKSTSCLTPQGPFQQGTVSPSAKHSVLFCGYRRSTSHASILLESSSFIYCLRTPSYRRDMSEVVIRSKENGPNLVMVDGKFVQAWCRCSGSSAMLFCDVMLKRNDFKAQPREVKVR